MQTRIKYSPLALQDLDEIWEYIAEELMSLSAAENTVNGIMDAVEGLSDFPEAGGRLVFDGNLDSGYRFVIYKNYMAFYHTKNNLIYVDRVIYGKRDYIKVLFPEDL